MEPAAELCQRDRELACPTLSCLQTITEMAPSRRPGLTLITRKAAPDDPMAALIWTAVPVEYCSPEMLAFRSTADPLRAADNAMFAPRGMPRSNHPEHPIMRHWLAGGVVLFGYVSLRATEHAKKLLDSVYYITRSGRIALRPPE